MPPVLRALCVALAVLLAVHACAAPFVENDLTFLVTIAADCFLLWLVWAFTKRQPHTMALLSACCVATTIVCLLFFPLADEYGRFTDFMRVQFVSELVVCSALFVVLRQPTTASWFAGEA